MNREIRKGSLHGAAICVPRTRLTTQYLIYESYGYNGTRLHVVTFLMGKLFVLLASIN
jgi:hypothetical protein